MDLNLSALIGATYLIPIAITLRRVYAPDFDMPAAMALAVARIDGGTAHHLGAPLQRVRALSPV